MLWIEQRVWRWLVHRMAKRATKRFGGHALSKAQFNTACFDQAVGDVTGVRLSNARLEAMLTHAGWEKLPGGCHWGKPANA